MRAHVRSLMGLLIAVVISGCSAIKGQPFDASLVGRQFYLCCNMRFDLEYKASDANYGNYVYRRLEAEASPRLPAGTLMKVVKVGRFGVAAQPLESQTTYTLIFHYGQKQMTPSQYFGKVLMMTNPMDAQTNLPPDLATALHEGRLRAGMTKEQALITRGYPPAHRTPNLESDEWIYYETPGLIDRVVFADGRIQSVTRGPAPQ